MNKTQRISVLVTGLTMAGASWLSAQTTTPQITSPTLQDTTVFVNINGGGQTQSRTLSTDFSFPVYGQTATVNTIATVDGGPIFDMSIGYRFKRGYGFIEHVGAAFGFTTFGTTGSASGAASIPSPIFFNRPAAVTIDAQPAKRTERSVYFVVVGFMPITDRLELAVSVGPSVTSVHQELITAVSVPAGTQTVVATMQKESGTAKSGIVGADLTYLFTKNIGIGGFVRYNGGSADLTSATGVKTGGAQLGVGVRLKY
jgi:hypothetical protein